jgi:RsiW-degrading membrane proteinase PrsW (M82 family)
MSARTVLSYFVAAYDGRVDNVGSGVISDGWNFIWAAYLVTWVAITAYGLSLWLRGRAKENGSSGN